MTDAISLPEDVERSLADFDELMDRKNRIQNPPQEGRLMFIVDATMSRKKFWGYSQGLMPDLFSATTGQGNNLKVQLCWFNGERALRSKWHDNPNAIAEIMSGVKCEAGLTQMEKLFRHAVTESQKKKVGSVVYVGDSCEEHAEVLVVQGSRMKSEGIKLFLLDDMRSTARNEFTLQRFKAVCDASGGIYAPFDERAIQQLKEAFAISGAYAAGGEGAVRDMRKNIRTQLGQNIVNQVLALDK